MGTKASGAEQQALAGEDAGGDERGHLHAEKLTKRAETAKTNCGRVKPSADMKVRLTGAEMPVAPCRKPETRPTAGARRAATASGMCQWGRTSRRTI